MTESSHRRAPWRQRLDLMLAVPAMALVVWFYHWTVAANSGFENWGDLDYYQLLVRGWKKGHLYLDKEPSPALLALKDPYDPEQNGAHRLGDASYYRGHYYIYFGPAPAATLMLPYSFLAKRDMTMGAATWVFASMAFLAASGLWLSLRRRYFPGSHPLMAPLGVLALGTGTHLLALTQRPMFWELAIAGGVAFSVLAVLAAYRAMHGRRPLLAMAGAGLCLGLAVGSRPTCLLAAPLLLAPIWLAWREARPGRSWWRMALAAALPLAACGALLMAHNYARFGNPLEWGQNYQLSGAYESKLTHFSVRFLRHNFLIYLFYPLRWTPVFPFVQAEGAPGCSEPGYFGTEEVAGLAATFPFVWFVLALPLVWWRRDRAERRRLAAGLAAIGGHALPVMALVMCYFSTTMRYEADFAVGIGVSALVGLLALERWAQATRPAWVWTAGTLGATLGAVTVVTGVLVSLDYHGRSVQRTAPMAWRALERHAQGLIDALGCRLGQVEGPREFKVRFSQRPAGTVETFWQAADRRAAERILIGHVEESLIRFGFARGTAPVEWGRLLRWEKDHTHTVSVQVPSLYSPSGHGWWDATRWDRSFRERTGVAVWFSGGRALGTVVPPLPRNLAGGGAMGADFSGELRRMATRPLRVDELATGLAAPHAPRGGVLRMRVIIADDLGPDGEPLFAAGAHYRSSILFVQPAPGGVKIVFENYSLPRVESAVFPPAPAGHWIEFELPSGRADAYGVEATGEVIVRLDGREILRTTQVGYPFPWGAEEIGSNPFGTTCAPFFRGWILEARWINASAGKT